jgi:hypothetical protein
MSAITSADESVNMCRVGEQGQRSGQEGADDLDEHDRPSASGRSSSRRRLLESRIPEGA